MVDFVVKSADPGIRYHVSRSGPFFSLYNDYAEKLGSSGNDINLRREGKLVSPLETPEDIEMEDGEALVASSRRGKANMDTRYKVFTMRACSRRPVKLKFKARVRTSLETVAQMWSEFSHMELGRLVMIRENGIILQFGNLGQSAIQNQDVIYAFALH